MKTLFAAAVAMSLLTGTATTAYADDHRDRGRHSERHQDRRHDRDDRGHDRRDHRDHRDYRDHRRDYDNHRGHDRDHDRRHDRRYDHDRRHYDWNRRDAYRTGYTQGRVDQRRYDRGRYYAPRGYQHRHWRHGDHLPRAYYSSSYIVHDYHVYHLNRPPRGHHWVRVNNDVVLAAVASGVVVSVVNGLFY